MLIINILYAVKNLELWLLVLKLKWTNSHLLAFQFSAGRFGEGNVFTEEDWAAEEGVNPYEKSKAKAEKAAWELVKNLQGVLVSSLIIIIIIINVSVITFTIPS